MGSVAGVRSPIGAVVTGSLFFYWRAYYGINRRTWPEMRRLAAAIDALKMARKVRRAS